jgi:hypothetical protein
MLQVLGIHLRKECIEKFSSFFTATGYQDSIIRCNDHTRIMANMRGKLFVQLIIDRKFLFAYFPEYARGFLYLVMEVEAPFDPEARFPLLHTICIHPREVTLGETKKMNGIKKVCFARSITTANSDHPLFEIKDTVCIVFKLQ